MTTVQDRDRPVGPDPAAPCVGCPSRDRCARECAALRALVPRDEPRRAREYPSRALTEGWGQISAAPVVEEASRGHPLSDAERAELHAAIARLTPRQRGAALAIAQTGDRQSAAATLGTSRDSVDSAWRRALQTLRRDLHLPRRSGHSSSVFHSAHPVSQEVVSMQKLTPRVGRVAPVAVPAPAPQPARTPEAQRDRAPTRARCGQPGCPALVSRRRPTHESLAPYCKEHRRLRMRALNRAARAANDGATLAEAAPLDLRGDRAGAAALAAADAPGGDVVRVEMSPALAMALLDRNLNNRTVSDARVALYARDMTAGEWRLNNQGIALGADGTLLDGQHRLWAVVNSGVTVPMLVVRGLPPEARATIDQGRSRSVGDTLRILDGTAHAARVTAYVRAIESLVAGRPAAVSPAVVRAGLARYAASFAWLTAHGPRHQPYSRAAVVGAIVYAHHVAADAVEAFAASYVSGADLSPGAPALTLRNYVLERASGRGRRDDDRTMMLKTLRALLAHVRGDRLERLLATDDGFHHFRALHAALAAAA